MSVTMNSLVLSISSCVRMISPTRGRYGIATSSSKRRLPLWLYRVSVTVSIVRCPCVGFCFSTSIIPQGHLRADSLKRSADVLR